ncbi:hypothetical protein Fmac_020779 [Flemingia macrophylla]|uniref:Uncharacterized protein n=1 Tax=Flemingia macrophylla TaxID=520843 RepID=A0ABD1LV00_9FABA
MAPQKMNEYERQRLHNICRNQQIIASLKLHSTANKLSSSLKRSRRREKKRKGKTLVPEVLRRSLRIQGMPPEPMAEGSANRADNNIAKDKNESTELFADTEIKANEVELLHSLLMKLVILMVDVLMWTVNLLNCVTM